jgi:hypothetical protein
MNGACGARERGAERVDKVKAGWYDFGLPWLKLTQG